MFATVFFHCCFLFKTGWLRCEPRAAALAVVRMRTDRTNHCRRFLSMSSDHFPRQARDEHKGQLSKRGTSVASRNRFPCWCCRCRCWHSASARIIIHRRRLWELVIDLYFVMDIAINFRTPFYNRQGTVETSTRAMALNYLVRLSAWMETIIFLLMRQQAQRS